VTLSILIWSPLALALIATQLPGRLVGRGSALVSLVPVAIAISYIARFNSSAAGLQFVTNRVWRSGSTTSSGSTGST
jgi:NADH:ubiquinone oxidoreductase subunit 4 (subunit M)